ncbi:MAG: EpsG family protein [Clostridia bacterium]|nr:EpsG family protein [Clostridia bacterium]
MALYISIAIFLIAGMLLEFTANRKEATVTEENSRLKKENKHTFYQLVFFLIVIFVLWFLTAFRSERIGNDTITYVRYFYNFGQGGVTLNSRIEIGYQILNFVVFKINPNPYFFLGVVATICYVGTGIYIYKYSDNIVFSTVLLFPIAYGFFATGLRQAVAMVICLYIYQAIKNRKFLLAILLILLASSFHTSALLMLVFLFHRLIPKKPFVVIPLTAIFIALSLSGVMDNIFATLMGDYGGYYENEELTSGWLSISYYTIRAIVFYGIAFLSYEKKIKENSLVLSLFTMLLVTISFGFSINVFTRATNYFLLISMVELPNAIHRGGLKHKKILMFLLGFIMVLYFLVTLIIRPEWNRLYPYQFNWN